jgi:hypothetical protein
MGAEQVHSRTIPERDLIVQLRLLWASAKRDDNEDTGMVESMHATARIPLYEPTTTQRGMETH